jgi:hypothetical protein
MENVQRVLSAEQTRRFYHDEFVSDQIEAFVSLGVPAIVGAGVVVDVGGGCGFFAGAISHLNGTKVRVLDSDSQSVDICKSSGIEAAVENALCPSVLGDESVTCFNLILHHLVGRTDSEVFELQSKALRAWCNNGRHVFVNEYIYESYWLSGVSAWLIWIITSSKLLSAIGRIVAFTVPSLRANTFGVGVRFRTSTQWRKMFGTLGYGEVGYLRGHEERVSIPRRCLLIRSCRRDSFLLRAVDTTPQAAAAE